MSSPAPVGMFLICNAAITEPPHLVSGWPLISESRSEPHPQGPWHQREPPAVEEVVRSVDFMQARRNLEQTPGLIDADSADDVGRMRAGIGVRAGAVGVIDRDARLDDGGAVPDHGVVETDRGRYAIAKLGGVLDVVAPVSVLCRRSGTR